MNTGMFDSKKAKALLIALLNIDLVLFAAVVFKADLALCSSVVTATLALVGVYIGAQGAVDTATAVKAAPQLTVNSVTSTTPPSGNIVPLSVQTPPIL